MLMAVRLNTEGLGEDKLHSLLTTSQNKQYRVQRVKDDLDHQFIEVDTKNRADLLGYPYIDLYGFPIDTANLILLSKEEVEKYKIGVFSLKNKELFLATSSLNYTGQNNIIASLTDKGYTCKIFLCSELSMKKLLNTYNFVVAAKTIDDNISISEDKMEQAKEVGDDLQKLGEKLQHTSTSELIETILVTALQNDASDIHFEPEKDEYNLRLRLDGVLHTFAHLPKTIQKTVESRVKLLSGLKLNVDNVPQDGRFSFKAQEKDIDVRVSMLPSSYGYSIVMRLLGTGSVALELDQLGFTGLAKKRVEDAIQKPQGMILTTGPTGSGKTTTLYTFLSRLNDGENKIITLEDPIEYKLSGVSQTQIDTAAGYTFASGLRSILRQDPDIVMVGEIRDRETAEIAVQAALTGHQVLSTIHTNDAAGSIPRMMEMGVKGYLLVDSLALVIGQRLVRRLCEYCKKPDELTDDEKKVVIEQLKKIAPTSGVVVPHQLSFHTATGCDKCNGLGYKGRVGLYEVMVVSENLKILLSNATPSLVEVRESAQKDGMLTMLQDGILKALQGVTDMKEILKNVV
jgi:type II secretory ATPase GspE/PulE/Tfp pilus assembly ATPase PilB-like protein